MKMKIVMGLSSASSKRKVLWYTLLRVVEILMIINIIIILYSNISGSSSRKYAWFRSRGTVSYSSFILSYLIAKRRF